MFRKYKVVTFLLVVSAILAMIISCNPESGGTGTTDKLSELLTTWRKDTVIAYGYNENDSIVYIEGGGFWDIFDIINIFERDSITTYSYSTGSTKYSLSKSKQNIKSDGTIEQSIIDDNLAKDTLFDSIAVEIYRIEDTLFQEIYKRYKNVTKINGFDIKSVKEVALYFEYLGSLPPIEWPQEKRKIIESSPKTWFMRKEWRNQLNFYR